jgi:hypothetical protein
MLNMIFCTIDPGIKNFAIYIEEFDHLKLQTLSFSKKRYEKGKFTKEYLSFLLNNIYTNGKLLYSNCVDISPPKKKYNSDLILSRCLLTQYFNTIRKYLDICDAFFVEKQLKHASFNIEIEHHCYSYFANIYGNNRVVSCIPANDKYTTNGCPPKQPKLVRKRWAADMGLKILNKRKDDKSVIDLSSKKKLDDIGDTILLCQTMKIRLFLSNT